MTYWRKETDADEFIGIALIAIGNQTDNKCLKDKIVYSNYPNPMAFLRYRKKVLGFESLIDKWNRQVAKDKGEASTHYRRTEFDLEIEEQAETFRNIFLIEKINHYLNSHLRWQNGKNGKQQFNHAKDIYYYFLKEENYQ